VLACKASLVAFSGFLSRRIRHSHRRVHPRVLCRARAALRRPLRSASRIASLASRFRASGRHLQRRRLQRRATDYGVRRSPSRPFKAP
jgi:hypothetical protein